MNNRIVKILKLWLITLFVSYYCESTLFYHTHVFEWGIISHSHLVWPNVQYNHTSGECQTIAQLTYILLITSALTVFLFFTELIKRLTEKSTLCKIQLIVCHNSLRAPPCYYW